jgi:hypothetical protein
MDPYLLNCGKGLDKRGKLATIVTSTKQGSVLAGETTPGMLYLHKIKSEESYTRCQNERINQKSVTAPKSTVL